MNYHGYSMNSPEGTRAKAYSSSFVMSKIVKQASTHVFCVKEWHAHKLTCENWLSTCLARPTLGYTIEPTALYSVMVRPYQCQYQYHVGY